MNQKDNKVALTLRNVGQGVLVVFLFIAIVIFLYSIALIADEEDGAWIVFGWSFAIAFSALIEAGLCYVLAEIISLLQKIHLSLEVSYKKNDNDSPDTNSNDSLPEL